MKEKSIHLAPAMFDDFDAEDMPSIYETGGGQESETDRGIWLSNRFTFHNPVPYEGIHLRFAGFTTPETYDIYNNDDDPELWRQFNRIADQMLDAIDDMADMQESWAPLRENYENSGRTAVIAFRRMIDQGRRQWVTAPQAYQGWIAMATRELNAGTYRRLYTLSMWSGDRYKRKVRWDNDGHYKHFEVGANGSQPLSIGYKARRPTKLYLNARDVM